ncbi:M15 family metallopeptidase [Sphingosinicellaceae bacterium]|nr:M15 family metallopeptidase [Sphingosinicellaceae bacterium]
MTAPPFPRADLAALIGQYGSSDFLLDIFEDGGSLWVEGLGQPSTMIDRVGPTTFVDAFTGRQLYFAVDGATLNIGGASLRRCDVGAERIALFQRSLDRQAADLLQSTTMAIEELVTLADVVPGIRVDIRYATAHNFMGFPVYDRAGAYARPSVAAALARVQATLSTQGYGLVVHDAYRPWSVTKLFWDVVPPEYRAFVADPAVGSKHNRGCAIDLSLCDARTGVLLAMPSRYDEPTVRASSAYRGGTSRARWHRDRLRDAMEANGFVVQPDEWWHFDFKAWQDYPIEDVSFAALGGE